MYNIVFVKLTKCERKINKKKRKKFKLNQITDKNLYSKQQTMYQSCAAIGPTKCDSRVS